jgi:acyl-coenzyme A synthetase/AMP-(fatty) acid ligase
MNLSELALRPGQDPARAGRPAFLTARGPVSNADFQRRVFALAEEFTCCGVRPSDKVLLRMINSADFAAAFLATIWIGAIPVLQNSQFGRSELEHIIALCEPTALLLSENFAEEPATAGLLPHAPRLVVESVGRRDSSSGSTAESIAVPAPFERERDAPAFIVFTSGTTGKPKGVIHAHQGLDELPKNTNGKVQRRQVARIVLDHAPLEAG